LTDVTESARLEDEHALQAQLLDAVEQAVIATDAAGIITYWGRFAETLYGWRADEVLGRPILEITPVDEAEALPIMAQLLRGESWSGEFATRRRDGTPFIAHVSDSPIRRGDEVIGVVGISRDITAEKARAARLEALLRAIPDLVLRVAADGTLLQVSAPARTRLPRRLSVGGNVLSLVRGEDGPHLLAAIRRAIDGNTTESADFRRSAIGDPHIFEARIVASGDDEVVAFVRDVTEVRRRGDELEKRVAERTAALERATRELLAEAERRSATEAALTEAHERLQGVTRSLLAVQESERHNLARELHDQIGQTLTGLKLLVGRAAADPEAAKDADRIIADLMGQVRNLSLDLRPAMLDEGGLIPALAVLASRYARQSGIVVKVRHGKVPRLHAEMEIAAFRIAQEALTNAIRHAFATKVTINVWTTDDDLLLQVGDDGAGFYGWDSTATAGLSGMRERAALLGGAVTIDSGAGAGTRITLNLPLQKGAA
jgi:PAS domain S-box-containing protein